MKTEAIEAKLIDVISSFCTKKVKDGENNEGLSPHSIFNSEEEWDEEMGELLMGEIARAFEIDIVELYQTFPHKLFVGLNIALLWLLPFLWIRALLGFDKHDLKYREYTIAEVARVIKTNFFSEQEDSSTQSA